MAGIFEIMESSATQWYQDVAPTQFYFFIVASIVYGAYRFRESTLRKKEKAWKIQLMVLIIDYLQKERKEREKNTNVLAMISNLYSKWTSVIILKSNKEDLGVKTEDEKKLFLANHGRGLCANEYLLTPSCRKLYQWYHLKVEGWSRKLPPKPLTLDLMETLDLLFRRACHHQNAS